MENTIIANNIVWVEPDGKKRRERLQKPYGDVG